VKAKGVLVARSDPPRRQLRESPDFGTSPGQSLASMALKTMMFGVPFG
jgi:hypothetical protein